VSRTVRITATFTPAVVELQNYERMQHATRLPARGCRRRNARAEQFNFLACTSDRHRHWETGRHIWARTRPRRALQNSRAKLSCCSIAPTRRHGLKCGQLNSLLVGWSAYFSYGARWSAYRAIDNHVLTRVRKFLGRRHKLRGRGTQFPVELRANRVSCPRYPFPLRFDSGPTANGRNGPTRDRGRSERERAVSGKNNSPSGERNAVRFTRHHRRAHPFLRHRMDVCIGPEGTLR
jgi:hypothetical protein